MTSYERQIKKEKIAYRDSIFLFIIAIIVFCISYWVDVKYEHNGSFLQRSGSILVLIGVLVEFLLYRSVSTIEIHSLISSPMNQKQRNMPKIYKKLKVTAHLFILIGTLTWGYVDLLWRI